MASGQYYPLTTDCPLIRLVPDLLHAQRLRSDFLRGSGVQRMCSIVHFFFFLLFEIEVKGDSATVWSRWTFVLPNSVGKPVISQIGRYDDILVREEGRWKFMRRTASNDIPAAKWNSGFPEILWSRRVSTW